MGPLFSLKNSKFFSGLKNGPIMASITILVIICLEMVDRLCFCHFPICCSGSGMVLDCIDS